MQLRELGLILLMGCTAVYGCSEEEGGDAATEGEAVAGEGEGEAGGEGGEAEGGEGEGGEEEPAGPVDACNALIEAAKAGDDAAVAAASTEALAKMGAEDADAKKAMQQMLGEATCGEAAVEGESATVPVTAGDKSRDIPFAMVDGAWKFDAAKYAELYPPPAKGKKTKKRKKRKGKRKKK